MTRKRSCVVREEADGAGPAMVPRHRPTSCRMSSEKTFVKGCAILVHARFWWSGVKSKGEASFVSPPALRCTFTHVHLLSDSP